MLGGIVGSAMGGFLAQPAIFYPSLFPADGIFGQYPYLLPNLVSVIIIVIVVIQGMLFLEETNPRGTFYKTNKKLAAEAVIEDSDEGIDETTPLTRGQLIQHPGKSVISECPVIVEEGLAVSVEQNLDLRRTSFGTADSIKGQTNAVSLQSEPEEYTGPSFNFTIIMLTIALVLVSYHQMAFATLLPTHLLDRPREPPGHLDLIGGLGYTIHDVGIYLSINGLLGLFIQGIIFPIFVDRVGVWRSFIFMVVLYPLSYVVSPFLSALPVSLQSWGIYLAMILQSLFGIVVIPTALILIKNATPSTTVLGRVNGLAMAGCCLARTLSPPLVGIIYASAGSAAAWFSCAVVAVLGIVQLFWVPREHVPTVVVDTAVLGRTISRSDRNNEYDGGE
ncbi:MFS general substrate transporter [Xylaria intraflava]|nr:MFS general substrate transporter [Xylaria intraflava]